MRRNFFIIVTSIALGLSGCTSSIDHLIEPSQPTYTQSTQARSTQYNYEAATPQKQQAYEKTMRKVASGIKDDPNYQRLALDTPEKKEWFKNLTYRLWDRQMTRQQFIAEGLKKYPNHGYEFNFIVSGFTYN